jgi:hypothetical protein
MATSLGFIAYSCLTKAYLRLRSPIVQCDLAHTAIGRRDGLLIYVNHYPIGSLVASFHH